MLVGLYEEPERPQNAVDYIKRYLGAPTGIDVEALRAECDQLRKDKQELEATVKALNQKVIIFLKWSINMCNEDFIYSFPAHKISICGI